jgi:hypothetical protein
MQELTQVDDAKSLHPDVLQQIMGIYNKIIVQYNVLTPKDIPYRSEAIADFLQANIFDEVHGFFMNVDMAYQQQFSKERSALQEQERQNLRLQSLIQTSSEKLNYIKNQEAGQIAERETMQLQLDDL